MSIQSGALISEPSRGPDAGSPATDVVLVVGYDGSPPSRRALGKASELLKVRQGWFEVVWVAHTPATAPLAADATAALLEGFDQQSVSLEKEVGSVLQQQRRPWRFQRGDGSVAAELVAAANELADRFGPSKSVAIVVGGPEHRYHRLAGSVGAGLLRSDRYPVIVVP